MGARLSPVRTLVGAAALAAVSLGLGASACSFELAGTGVVDASARDGANNLDAAGEDAASVDGAIADALAESDSASSNDGGLDGAGDGAVMDGAIDSGADAAPTITLRYNLNGSKFTSTTPAAAGVWQADPGNLCGPSTYTADAVYGTSDGPLYVGEVFGDPLVCEVGSNSLPPGDYQITLYFAEIYFGPGCPGGGEGIGARVFDVAIEGTVYEQDLDLYKLGKCLATDGGAPIVKSYRVTVTDGAVSVRMPATQNNGCLNAIKIEGPY